MTINGFTIPTKQPATDTWKSLDEMRRAMLLEMYGSLKWFGTLDSGDALALAEQIRRRKEKGK